MHGNQFMLVAPPSIGLPEGFAYKPEVISPAEESRLLAEITRLPFKEFQFHGLEGKRRGVSFGWRYDFSEEKRVPADPIPPWLLDTFRRGQGATGFEVPDA